MSHDTIVSIDQSINQFMANQYDFPNLTIHSFIGFPTTATKNIDNNLKFFKNVGEEWKCNESSFHIATKYGRGRGRRSNTKSKCKVNQVEW